MLNILQCFKKIHRWRKARPIQGKRGENVEYMNANMLQICEFKYSMFSRYYLLFGLSSPSSPPPGQFMGSEAKPFSSSLRRAFPPMASPIAQLYCTPPTETTLTFGSRTCHSHKKSSGWQQGHPCIKALNFNSTYPT